VFRQDFLLSGAGSGNGVQEKLISGHPLLVTAALQAVSQRKYEPTILDGQATPVDLRVEISFRMS